MVRSTPKICIAPSSVLTTPFHGPNATQLRCSCRFSRKMPRDYENTPRPEVEQHPHIRFLIESQNRRALDRTMYQNRDKARAERISDIKAVKDKEVKEFYCTTCRVDFFAWAIKEVEVDWSNPTSYIAFYRTKCAKGHWCMRHITDTFKDSYFFRSRKIVRERGVYFADTVQSWETGFQLLYGRKNRAD